MRNHSDRVRDPAMFGQARANAAESCLFGRFAMPVSPKDSSTWSMKLNLTSHLEQLEWISTTLVDALAVVPADLDVSIRIFITSGSRQFTGNPRQLAGGQSVIESQSERDMTNNNAMGLLTVLDAVLITPGRPELNKMLKKEIAAAAGRLSVTGMLINALWLA